jgi:predicted small secreted protein
MKSEIIIRTILLCAVLALSIATAASCLNVLRKRDEEIEHARESASKLGSTFGWLS